MNRENLAERLLNLYKEVDPNSCETEECLDEEIESGDTSLIDDFLEEIILTADSPEELELAEQARELQEEIRVYSLPEQVYSADVIGYLQFLLSDEGVISDDVLQIVESVYNRMIVNELPSEDEVCHMAEFVDVECMSENYAVAYKRAVSCLAFLVC